MNHTRYYTTLSEALFELQRRRKDEKLVSEVETYLNGDMLESFHAGPVLYFARHVATPNKETLAFLGLGQHLDMRCVIGQDSNDIFVTHNTLKRSLGKMPIVKGYSKTNDEIIEYVTIVDFNKWQGCRLGEIQTLSGVNLINFHNSLFEEIRKDKLFMIRDDALWIDRNERGNLLEHYKKHLALFIVHGILFEYFPKHDTAEQRMVSEVLAPAYDFIRARFGVTPLITPPVTPSQELVCNWEAYPEMLLKYAKKQKGVIA
jgi:hypothetical protein